MDKDWLIAIMGLLGAVLGLWIPTLRGYQRLLSRFRHHSLVGIWNSAWGPLPSGPTKHEEILEVSKQSGQRIEGHITRSSEPDRRWDFEGRYDGLFLQLYYFPSPEAADQDFQSHGCYFFKREPDGSFKGYSSGFGEADDGGEAGTTVDYHVLKRRGSR